MPLSRWRGRTHRRRSKQMSQQASCPINYTFVGGICYGACPAGMQANVTYADTCVQNTACPTGTIEDTTGLACTKTSPTGIQDKTTSCATGYTEWSTGKCYINCPTGLFFENGTECRRKTAPRPAAIAKCPFPLSTAQSDGSCAVDWWKVVAALVVVYIAWRATQPAAVVAPVAPVAACAMPHARSGR